MFIIRNMSLIVTLIVAAVVAIVTVALGRNTAKKPTLSPDSQVTIMMLGFRGSGKTLMLASMFKHFRLGGAAGITLITDDQSERDLELLIDKIQDTTESYLPDSTGLGDTRAWDFGVRVLAERGKTADAFRLQYLDYAGEYAELASGAGGGEVDPVFKHTLESTDILIGVLDGEKLRRLLTEKDQQHVVFELERLLRLLIRANRPCVHLVISKWDRLSVADGRHFSLDEVVARLEAKSDGFRSFRLNPQFNRIRIIPVSTLGHGFVDVLPDGMTVKRPGARWQPDRIALPFYCTLPDILSCDISQMSAHAENGSMNRTSLNRERLAQITLGVFAVADIAMKMTPHGMFVAVPFSAIGERVRTRLATVQREPEEFGQSQALARVLQASYKYSEDYDRDPTWRVKPPGPDTRP